MSPAAREPHQMVIVGGGSAGISVAARLARGRKAYAGKAFENRAK